MYSNSSGKTSKFYNDNDDGFYITDTCNGKTTCEYNSKFSEITGYDNPSEIAGKDLSQLIHPNDLGKFTNAKKSLSKQNPFESFNIRIIKRDRSVLYTRCSLILTFTDDGYERIIHAFTDMNESMNIKQQNDIFLSMPPILFKFHREGRFPYYFNNSFLDTLGYTREEITALNITYKDIIAPDDAQLIIHAVRNAINSDTVSSCIFKVYDKEKNIHWINCSFKKLSSPSGTQYFMGIGNDITEQKKIESELEDIQALLNTVTYNTNYAVLGISVENNNLPMIFSNEKFSEMFMFSSEKIKLFSDDICRHIIHPDDYEFFVKSVLSDDKENFQCRAVKNSGETILISVQCSKIRNIYHTGIVCTIYDISHTNALSNELDKYESLYNDFINLHSAFSFKIDFSEDTVIIPEIFAKRLNIGTVIPGIPNSIIDAGFIPKNFGEDFCKMYYSVKNGAPKGSCAIRFNSPAGRSFWAQIHIFPVYNEGICPIKAIGTIEDISDKIMAEEQLMHEEWYEPLLNSDTLMMCMVNLSQNKILSFRHNNDSFNILEPHMFFDNCFIYDLVSLIHIEERQFISEQIIHKNLWKAYLGGNYNINVKYRLENNEDESQWVEMSINFIKNLPSDDVIFVMYLKTASQLGKNNENISNSTEDVFTKIPFKTTVNEFFMKNKFNGCLHALYILDFDGFNSINNIFGYDIENRILQATAQKINALEHTVTIGRLFGDKLLVFAEDIASYDDLNITARNLCDICLAITIAGVDVNSLSVSVGVAFAPLHGMDFDTLYSKADNALYNAKRFGKNKYAIYIDASGDKKEASNEHIYKITKNINIDEFKKEASSAILRKNVNYKLYNVDMKNFRNINHYFGYETGDKILKETSEILQNAMKPGEYMTRIFADNYLLLTIYENDEKSKKRLQSLCDKVLMIPEISEHLTSFSIGYIEINDSNRHIEFEHLLDCAILAHRNSKKSEQTRIVKFSSEMTDESMQQYQIISELKEAIKCGQICCYVQPQYDLIRHEYVSMEALVRWNHPIKGLLTPDKFIDICEKNGFISNIDFCVLEQMCMYIRSRMLKNLRVLPVAINQSQITIHEPGYFKRLTDLVEKYEIPPRYLELEVTESAYVNNLGHTIEILTKLKDYGFSISMDDFGTGYSSLNLLKDIPIDILKLDRGFLTEGLTEKKPKEIIKSITNMAHNINVRVICEGVENPQQIPFLEEIGCELAQGYLFGKPMPYNEIEDFIKSSPMQAEPK